MAEKSDEITQLLSEVQRGDREAANRLMPLVYQELRVIARHEMGRMDRRPNHTLQPTALVHEAFLRMAGPNEGWQSRAHFFGIAANLMRHILVDHARAHRAAKRGGGEEHLPIVEEILLDNQRFADIDMIALDEALDRLSALDARQGRIVELRFFAELTVEETAEVLGISPKTVRRDWSLARSWLRREISRT